MAMGASAGMSGCVQAGASVCHARDTGWDVPSSYRLAACWGPHLTLWSLHPVPLPARSLSPPPSIAADVVILDRQDRVAWRGVEVATAGPSAREKHTLTALSGGRLLLFGGAAGRGGGQPAGRWRCCGRL